MGGPSKKAYQNVELTHSDRQSKTDDLDHVTHGCFRNRFLQHQDVMHFLNL